MPRFKRNRKNLPYRAKTGTTRTSVPTQQLIAIDACATPDGSHLTVFLSQPASTGTGPLRAFAFVTGSGVMPFDIPADTYPSAIVNAPGGVSGDVTVVWLDPTNDHRGATGGGVSPAPIGRE